MSKPPDLFFILAFFDTSDQALHIPRLNLSVRDMGEKTLSYLCNVEQEVQILEPERPFGLSPSLHLRHEGTIKFRFEIFIHRIEKYEPRQDNGALGATILL